MTTPIDAAPQPAAPAAAPTAAPVVPAAVGTESALPVSIPAPVTPAAAPVAPPAAPVPEGKFEASGNPALDVALEFISGHGLGPDHPAIKAAEEGNFALLEAHLGVLGDKAKGWERYVAIAKAALVDIKSQADAKAAEQRAVVSDAVGGDERWKSIQTWAAANAEPAEREAVNAALAAGGIAAKAMAQYLAGLHDRASGTTVYPREAVPAQLATPSAAEPLSSKQYHAEVAKLNHKLGGRLDGSKEYAALQTRRAQAKAMGY